MDWKERIVEQERTDAFDRLCGSKERARRLYRIYATTYGPDKRDAFRRRALWADFTDAQIDALLLLQ